MSSKEIVVVQNLEFEGGKSKLSALDHALTKALEDSFEELRTKIGEAYKFANFNKKASDPTVHFSFESEDPKSPVPASGCYIVATIKEA